VTILLFDTLNTDRQSLVSARQHLLRYLSKLTSNDRVALFTLDSDCIRSTDLPTIRRS
jgi:hypothetical protein